MMRFMTGLVLLTFAISSRAELWITPSSDKNGVGITAVDTDTFVIKNGRRIAWVYMVSSNGKGGIGEVRSYRVYWDCAAQELSFREWSKYDPSSLDIREQGQSIEVQRSPDPSTSAYFVMEFACGLDPESKQPRTTGDFAPMEGKGIRPVVEFAREAIPKIAEEAAKEKK